ncbi:MAG: alanine--tRNA ligase, partial [Eggerthellaceae bacterium]|nr:alanine--tRNA ligase [Eggerthellaceae bacterium]
HFQAVTRDEIARIEKLANDEIMKAIPLSIYETSLDEARASGVTALFGEKYGETVRVVEASDFSRELCGGCHVKNTAEIGFVKITSEGSVGASTRRIEAVTSYDALAYMNKMEDELREAAEVLHVPLFDVSDRAASNLRQLKDVERRVKVAKSAVEADAVDKLLEGIIDVGYPLLVMRRDNADTTALRNTWDAVRNRMSAPGAIVIGTVNEGKPVIMAAATDEAVAAGFNAGQVIKAIAPHIQGGGGGKPQMAQAGGKNPDGLDAALDAARALFAQ